ncbi:hypothetical protein GGI13_007479 [Coemansia sp. RSA 455]|nr:hypothetical protein GGI13_007479 [Coemansia sp. RSA 455]
MNLDKTRNIQYRQQAWQFVQQLVAERQERPDIPLILFSHIPLHKPAGACVASPSIRYQNDFVEYQDYLSPTTSAYLLHCLAPTFVLSGHDHNGCQAAHSVKTGVSQAIPLGAAGKSLRSASDLCSLTFEELDEFQTEIEEFVRQTVTPASGFDSAGTNAWDTLEVTVRSAMGEFDGAAGIFDIHKSGHYHPSSPQRYARALGRNVLASADGYEYRYREVMLGNHLAIRVEVELLALKDVTVATTGLARARGDDGVEAARDKLVINGRLDGALAGKALGKGALGTGLLSLSGLGLVIDSLTLLLAEDLGITVLVPLTEGSSVDLDDGALHKGVGADKLVVGGVVDDRNNTSGARDGLGAPRVGAGLKAHGAVLLVATTDTHFVDALGAQLGASSLATELELSLLAVLGALGAGVRTLVAGVAADTYTRAKFTEGD